MLLPSFALTFSVTCPRSGRSLDCQKYTTAEICSDFWGSLPSQYFTIGFDAHTSTIYLHYRFFFVLGDGPPLLSSILRSIGELLRFLFFHHARHFRNTLDGCSRVARSGTVDGPHPCITLLHRTSCVADTGRMLWRRLSGLGQSRFTLRMTFPKPWLQGIATMPATSRIILDWRLLPSGLRASPHPMACG
jgi:hypothetical protein